MHSQIPVKTILHFAWELTASELNLHCKTTAETQHPQIFNAKRETSIITQQDADDWMDILKSTFHRLLKK